MKSFEKQLLDVSVLIPAFNAEKYLARALRSILMNRTQFSYEVIVIDEPACCIPIFILSETGRRGSVWSIFEEITNMSSTPIPISKNGRRL